ncbi:MAG: hypothetical protein K6F69_05790 [Treponema sp.]|nr:hypothetical protein [Treponema sp.]
MIKRFIVVSLALTMALTQLHSEVSVNASTEQKAALRYLETTRIYVENNKWAEALSQSNLALAYDDTISDLWYYNALALNALESVKTSVILSCKKAIDNNNWFGYNRDNARILYADLLSDSHGEKTALDILNAAPSISNADAEYIRAKSYYHQNNSISINLARKKIAEAIRLYPDDGRFPLLFLKSEHLIALKNGQVEQSVQKLANYFIMQRNHYIGNNSTDDLNLKNELDMYFCVFARGNNKIRLLQSFDSRQLKNELYPIEALKARIYDDEEAFSYFEAIATDSPVKAVNLENLIDLISDKDVCEKVNAFLASFNGSLITDVDADGVDDCIIKYEHGRPSEIVFDVKQDGSYVWKFSCDYGIPFFAAFTDANVELSWSYYPSIASISYKDDSDSEVLRFNVLPSALNWSPVVMNASKSAHRLGQEFFIPSINANIKFPTDEQLMASSSGYEIKSNERKNAKIYFGLLDGKIQFANYIADGKLYARTQFRDGLPISRVIDNDNDGVYETTEIYEFAKNNEDSKDSRKVLSNLFGFASHDADIYLKSVQINAKNDINADFMEEYFPASDGKVASWDENGDGNWDMRYAKSGSTESSMFYRNADNILVTVVSEDGIPQKILRGKEELPVKQDSLGLFWINVAGNEEDAKIVIEKLNQIGEQGVCIIAKSDRDYSIRAVKVGEFYFGEIIK